MFDVFNQIMFNIKLGKYKYLGSGSSREVFDLGNGYVIKVARNMAGMAQNMSEYQISYNDSSHLFAKVMKASQNFEFIIMEKAKRINTISYIWDYFNINNKNELFNLDELKKIKGKYNLVLADLAKKSSWGIINGKPVIIDYGFTRAVKENYY